MALSQWRAEDAEFLGFQINHPGQGDVRFQALHPGAGRVHYALCQGGIVVAWQHDPGAGKALGSIEHPANGSVGDCLCIEHVTGHQYGIALMVTGQLSKCFNGLKPRFDQGCTVFRFKTGKARPICQSAVCKNFGI